MDTSGIRKQLAELQARLDKMEQEEKDAKRRKFRYVVAYYREDRDAWIVRFFNYGQKHVKQFETEDEAMLVAKLVDDAVHHVLYYPANSSGDGEQPELWAV